MWDKETGRAVIVFILCCWFVPLCICNKAPSMASVHCVFAIRPRLWEEGHQLLKRNHILMNHLEGRPNISQIFESKYQASGAQRWGILVKVKNLLLMPAKQRNSSEHGLFGRQVSVTMEYSRRVEFATEKGTTDRLMNFGTVFVVSPTKGDAEGSLNAPPTAGNQQPQVNVAEMILSHGFGTVIEHWDSEVQSTHYYALLSAESRAIAGKKGIHSARDPPAMHITDLLTNASCKKAKEFLPLLQRNCRMPAIVDYVLCGHRFKLLIPMEKCSIAFSLSGVRCPGRNEPYSNEAIALMRRNIMQRDVEIEVETSDQRGTFLGSLWESKTNVAVTTLLEAGLAKLQTSSVSDRISDLPLLMQVEQNAKKQKLKIWENYAEETLQVMVTEILGGGKFYVQTVGKSKVASLRNKPASLNIQEAPVIGSFNPKKGDVLAQFSVDGSWYRAMIVNAPKDAVEPPSKKFEVFYIDYGNQEVVLHSQIRPIDPSVASALGLAHLCSLAYIKLPGLEEDYGRKAAEYLSALTLDSLKVLKAVIEERDVLGGKVGGQGTGTILSVTLVDVETDTNINSAMLKEGYATLEKRRRWEAPEKKLALDNLEKVQAEARTARLNTWQY